MALRLALALAALGVFQDASELVKRAGEKLKQQDYAGAIADCKKAIELNANDPAAHYDLGIAYFEMKQFDSAIASFSKAIELKPHPSTYHMRAVVRYEKGDYDPALKDADRAVELDPKDAAAHAQRACCLMAKRNIREAKAAFEQALKLGGEGWPLRPRVEALLSVLPDVAGGPTGPARKKVLDKGRDLLTKGEMDKAIEILEEAVRLDPRSPEPYEPLIGAYFKRADEKRGDRARARLLTLDAVALGKPLSLQLQKYFASSMSQVLASLLWLARHQMPDGRWSSESVSDACRKESDVKCDGKGKAGYDLRATSLAILAFHGAGYSALSKDNYGTKPVGATVQEALKWMLSQQKADGSLGAATSERFLEDHAIATLALCESYGMTASKPLEAPVRKAVDFLVLNRPAGKGWAARAKGDEPDAIATGWALFALGSAKLAEIKVPADAVDQPFDWLKDLVIKSDPTGRNVAETSAIAAAAFHGKKLEGVLLESNLKALSESLPGREAVQRDALLTFMTAMALRLGDNGARWESWRDRSKTILNETARFEAEGLGCPTGSWDAVGLEDGPRGLVITTSLNVLTLEIIYRYANALCNSAPSTQKK